MPQVIPPWWGHRTQMIHGGSTQTSDSRPRSAITRRKNLEGASLGAPQTIDSRPRRKSLEGASLAAPAGATQSPEGSRKSREPPRRRWSIGGGPGQQRRKSMEFAADTLQEFQKTHVNALETEPPLRKSSASPSQSAMQTQEPVVGLFPNLSQSARPPLQERESQKTYDNTMVKVLLSPSRAKGCPQSLSSPLNQTPHKLDGDRSPSEDLPVHIPSPPSSPSPTSATQTPRRRPSSGSIPASALIQGPVAHFQNGRWVRQSQGSSVKSSEETPDTPTEVKDAWRPHKLDGDCSPSEDLAAHLPSPPSSPTSPTEANQTPRRRRVSTGDITDASALTPGPVAYFQNGRWYRESQRSSVKSSEETLDTPTEAKHTPLPAWDRSLKVNGNVPDNSSGHSGKVGSVPLSAQKASSRFSTNISDNWSDRSVHSDSSSGLSSGTQSDDESAFDDEMGPEVSAFLLGTCSESKERTSDHAAVPTKFNDDRSSVLLTSFKRRLQQKINVHEKNEVVAGSQSKLDSTPVPEESSRHAERSVQCISGNQMHEPQPMTNSVPVCVEGSSDTERSVQPTSVKQMLESQSKSSFVPGCEETISDPQRSERSNVANLLSAMGSGRAMYHNYGAHIACSESKERASDDAAVPTEFNVREKAEVLAGSQSKLDSTPVPEESSSHTERSVQRISGNQMHEPQSMTNSVPVCVEGSSDTEKSVQPTLVKQTHELQSKSMFVPGCEESTSDPQRSVRSNVADLLCAIGRREEKNTSQPKLGSVPVCKDGASKTEKGAQPILASQMHEVLIDSADLRQEHREEVQEEVRSGVDAFSQIDEGLSTTIEVGGVRPRLSSVPVCVEGTSDTKGHVQTTGANQTHEVQKKHSLLRDYTGNLYIFQHCNSIEEDTSENALLEAQALPDAECFVLFSYHERTVLKSYFDMHDFDHNGSLTIVELLLVIDDMGRTPMPNTTDERTLRDLFTNSDKDNSGELDFAEFLKLMELYYHTVYLRVFHKNDRDKSGAISIYELNHVVKDLQEAKFYADSSDTQKLLDSVDKDGNGFLDWEEFCDLMEHYRLLEFRYLELTAGYKAGKLESLRVMFDEADVDKSGYLDIKEALALLEKTNLGSSLYDHQFLDEFVEIYSLMDNDKSATLDFAEFLRLLFVWEKMAGRLLERRGKKVKKSDTGFKGCNSETTIDKQVKTSMTVDRVENRLLVKKYDMSLEEIEALRENFLFCDADGSGTIDNDELPSLLKNCGCQPTTTVQKECLATCLARHGGELDFNALVGLIVEYYDSCVESVKEYCHSKTGQNDVVPVGQLVVVLYQVGLYMSRAKVDQLLLDAGLDLKTMGESIPMDVFKKVLETIRIQRLREWRSTYGFKAARIREFEKVFEEYCTGETNAIALDQVEYVGKILGYHEPHSEEPTVLKRFMSMSSQQGKDEVTWNQFLLLLMQLENQQTLQRMQEEHEVAEKIGLDQNAVREIRTLFEGYDDSQTGVISKHSVRSLCSTLSVAKTQHQRKTLRETLEAVPDAGLDFMHFLYILQTIDASGPS